MGGPPSYKTGPGSISATGGIGSEGPLPSPPSVAPSPLPTPRSQPASVPQQEPSMPTLSPQPLSDKTLAVSPDNCAPKSVSSISHQVTIGSKLNKFIFGKNIILYINLSLWSKGFLPSR